ncbi:hypothetical protein J6590_063703 [Homalodisca vitripennis]|nr:hypothetical protein J6590_063703 [Homalodisca vitripennis]
MTKVYGENYLNRANFYKWVQQFKNGRDSVTNEHRPVEVPQNMCKMGPKGVDADMKGNKAESVHRATGAYGREAGKVMLTVLWDAEGPVFCDYLEEQHTIDSQYYSDMLLNEVNEASHERGTSRISEKRCDSPTRQCTSSYCSTKPRNH